MNEKRRAGRVKRGLLIAALVLAVLVVVATVVVTGAVPVGTVTLDLDQEEYRRSETVTLTIRSLRTGIGQFGTFFRVQRFEDGNWVDVPLDRFWRHVLIVLHTGQTCQQSFVPAQDFFETPIPGRYRVVKEVQVGMIHAGANRETRILIAEFRIR